MWENDLTAGSLFLFSICFDLLRCACPMFQAFERDCSRAGVIHLCARELICDVFFCARKSKWHSIHIQQQPLSGQC
jgi:hypothetical protein